MCDMLAVDILQHWLTFAVYRVHERQKNVNAIADICNILAVDILRH